MRYKQQIHEFFIKYYDEELLVNYRKKKSIPLDDIDEKEIHRILNTFSWLFKHNASYIILDELIIKPTNSEILEAMLIMKKRGNSLLIYAKEHSKGEVRTNLIKMAKQRIDCAEYYTQLVNEDFFKDK